MAFSVQDYVSLTENIGYFKGGTICGLIRTKKGIYIVDSGRDNEDGESLCRCVSELFPGERIAAVLLTHAHPDHCRGDSAIKRGSGAEIWTSYDSDCLLRFPLFVPAADWGGAPPESLTGSQYMISEHHEADRILSDGEILDLENVSVECIDLPGHFYGQLGFLVTDRECGKKVFFLGDGFFGHSMITRIWLPFIYEPELFRQSVGKIEGIGAEWYVSSHAEPCTPENIHELAEFNIMVTYELEGLILKIVDKKPLGQEEILKEVADYALLNMKMIPWVLIGSTVRSYLSSMQKRNLVTCTMESNRLLWSRCDSQS